MFFRTKSSMLTSMRTRLTYSNVMATLALFVALGGSATAGRALITSKQIKDGSVREKDLHKKVRAKLKSSPGTGTQGPRGDKGDSGDSGPQGQTGAAGTPATKLWVVVNPGLSCPASCVVRQSGVTSVVRNSTGIFTVTFNQDVSNCAYPTALGSPEGGTASLGQGLVSVVRGGSNDVNVYTWDHEGATAPAEDHWFHLAVLC